MTEERRPEVLDPVYATRGRVELGASLGLMPFDARLVTPNAQLLLLGHVTRRVGLGMQLGGGYGLPTAATRELDAPPYHGAPDDWRYLASVAVGGEWAPIYAKAMVGGRVVHADLFLAKRIGLTLQSSTADGRLLLSPTFSPTVGSHLCLGPRTAIRAEFRYDLLVDAEPASLQVALGQNADVLVGLTTLVRGRSEGEGAPR